MLFWIVAIVMTLGVCLILLAPLGRAGGSGASANDHEIEVYRDQLAEIEKDRRRGLIEDSEAEQARAEIGRKIIRLADAVAGEAAAGRSRVGNWVATIAVLSLPAIGWGVYAATGSPFYEDQPLAARLERPPSQATPEEMIARAEARLAENPDDVRGWDLLAPIYLRRGSYEDAARAYAQAIDLDGPTVARLVGSAEAITGVAGGRVTENARDRVTAALSLDADEPRALYLAGLAAAQSGDADEAQRRWRQIEATQPDDSPWHKLVADARDGASDAAEAASPDIEGMVAGLDARLQANPDDVDGWQRLIRSYMVLERRADAQDALRRATAAFGAGTPQAGHLAAYALSLGLDVEG